MERKFRVFDIKWGPLDDEDVILFEDEENEEIEYPSTTMEVIITEDDVDDINDDEEIEDYISDYITDETEFLHDGFNYEEIFNEN